MTANSIRKKLQKHVAELPVLPQTVVSLMSLDPDSDEFFDELIGVIQPEPTFAARVLAMANSAVSGPQDPITSIPRAVSRIGSRGARGLILALAVTRVFVPRDDWEKSLWRHSFQVAATAKCFAGKMPGGEVDAEEAFACGLLHDIGRFVLFNEGPEDLRRIDEAGWESPQELIALEQSVCGMTHGELGELACRRWKLPESICAVVRDHHARLSLPTQDPEGKLTALVQAADQAVFSSAVPGSKGFEKWSDEETGRFIDTRLSPLMAMSAKELRSSLAMVATEVQQATTALGLN